MSNEAARIKRLEAAAIDCAEYMEAIIEDEFDGGCDWPDLDASEPGQWCSDLCKEFGCMKSRSHDCRAALAAAKEQQPLPSSE